MNEWGSQRAFKQEVRALTTGQGPPCLRQAASFHTCPGRRNLWPATRTKRGMGTEPSSPGHQTPIPYPAVGETEAVRLSVGGHSPLAFFLYKPTLGFTFLSFLYFFVIQLMKEYVLVIHDSNKAEVSIANCKVSLPHYALPRHSCPSEKPPSNI